MVQRLPAPRVESHAPYWPVRALCLAGADDEMAVAANDKAINLTAGPRTRAYLTFRKVALLA